MAKKSKDFKKTVKKLKDAQIEAMEANLGGYTAEEKKVYDTIKEAVSALPAEQVIQGEVPIPEMVKVEMPKAKDESLSKVINKLKKDIEEVKKELKEKEKEQKPKKEPKATATKVKDVAEDEDDENFEEEDSNKIKAYKFANKIRRYTIGDLVAENIIEGKGIKDSIKGAISAKTKASITDMKMLFDPMNIAEKVVGRGGAAIFGKLTGAHQSELEYFGAKYRRNRPSLMRAITGFGGKVGPSPSTATKVDSTDMGDSTVVLGKIYSLMTKNREEDVKARELENDKKQDEFDLKEKRHKELLAALSKLTGAPIASGDVGGGEDSGGGLLAGIAGAGVLGAAKRFLKGGAKGAAGAAEGLAEGAAKSATKVSKFLESAKGILKFLEKIPGLSVIAAGASLIYDVKTAIDKHEAGEISDQELRKEIIGSLGGAIGGLGGAELGGLLGGAIGSVVPGAGTLVGGILGGTAGFFGGEKLGSYAAEKMFDYFSSGKDAEPPADPQAAADKLSEKGSEKSAPAAAPSGGGGGSMPTAAPVSASPQSSGAPASAPAAAPSSSPASAPVKASATPSPNAGQQLNSKTKENQSMKMDNQLSKGKTTVVNNTKSGGGGKKTLSYVDPDDTSKLPLPNIRNKESTYERVVYYNTRVV